MIQENLTQSPQATVPQMIPLRDYQRPEYLFKMLAARAQHLKDSEQLTASIVHKNEESESCLEELKIGFSSPRSILICGPNFELEIKSDGAMNKSGEIPEHVMSGIMPTFVVGVKNSFGYIKDIQSYETGSEYELRFAGNTENPKS